MLPTYSQGTRTPGMWSSTPRRSEPPCDAPTVAAPPSLGRDSFADDLDFEPPADVGGGAASESALGPKRGRLLRFQGCFAASSRAFASAEAAAASKEPSPSTPSAGGAPKSGSQVRGNAEPSLEVSTSAP